MRLQLNGISKKVFGVLVLVLATANMSCSKLQFDELASDSLNKLQSSLGGDIYSGKVYVHRKDNLTCADGTDVASIIIEDKIGVYTLVRESCAALSPAPVLDPDSITPINDNQLEYAGNEYTKEFDLGSSSPVSGQPGTGGKEPVDPSEPGTGTGGLVCYGYSYNQDSTEVNSIQETYAKIYVQEVNAAFEASIAWGTNASNMNDASGFVTMSGLQNMATANDILQLQGRENGISLDLIAELSASGSTSGRAHIFNADGQLDLNLNIECHRMQTGGLEPNPNDGQKPPPDATIDPVPVDPAPERPGDNNSNDEVGAK